MFLLGVGTFLFSKEIWVVEHEFYTGVATVIAWGTIAKMVGPGLSEYLQKEIANDEKDLK